MAVLLLETRPVRQQNSLIQPHAPAKTAEFVNDDAIAMGM